MTNTRKNLIYIGKIIMAYILVCLTIVVGLVILSSFDDQSKYPNGGRDTYAQFGDHRFVILSGEGPLVLYDQSDEYLSSGFRYKENNNVVENHIYGYIEIEPFIYVIGLYGYTKLNYVNGDLVQTDNINEFNSDDQLNFLLIKFN